MEVMTVVVVIHVVGEAASPLLAEQVVRELLALLSLRAGLGAGPRLSRGIEAPAGIPLARRFPGQRSPTPPPIPVAVWRTEDSKGRPVANKLIAAIRYAATPSKLAVANFYVYTSKFTADNSSTLVATKFHHVF